MSQINVQIEDRLNAAGYKTDRIGDSINVFDPVHRSAPGEVNLVFDHFKLVEIRSLPEAWKFIEERS